MAKQQVASPCREAFGIVHGNRRWRYGHPADNFRDIAVKATITLRRKLTQALSVKDVMLLFEDIKTCREANTHGHDNLVDLCGYAEAGHMAKEKLGDAFDKPVKI
jgi:hypothetical protein